MPEQNLISDPLTRHLRIFAFDPSVAAQLDLAAIAEITVTIPWEANLLPGPLGEYIEVVDADPASDMFYTPVDLNDPRILAGNGLAPSERNPQFHQQMVYAVAMTTINHFEQALGRVALWSSHRTRENDKFKKEFVRRLRIYPHALRERNAYYSPDKKALLFGYFPAASSAPGTLVFTCLSHDIVAHETTHALLDGVHPRFNEPVNPDVLAFHEAFADIVALFQHFSYPGVLRDQIARTRGNLASQNLLAQLAQQFGKASGRSSALRDALGANDPKTGVWTPHRPDVRALEKAFEPHERGAILVAAVFGAFLKVYKIRTADLYRIASEGTGVLREGELHPDLANRLAIEARRAASYILQMCIRGLDYCPPVGINFGDYLRAVVTGDFEFNAEDAVYCLAFVESFREWGINPRGRSTMSVEGLLWPTQNEAAEQPGAAINRGAVRALLKHKRQVNKFEYAEATSTISSSLDSPLESLEWNLETDRAAAWKAIDDHSLIVWTWLIKGEGRPWARSFGLVLDGDSPLPPPTVFRSKSSANMVAVEVHSVRSAIRRTPRGGIAKDLVVEITQRRRGYFDPKKQEAADDPKPQPKSFETDEYKEDFVYRAGCTLLIDPANAEVRRVIRTSGTIADNGQLERVRKFLVEGLEPSNTFNAATRMLHAREPFALLHADG